MKKAKQFGPREGDEARAWSCWGRTDQEGTLHVRKRLKAGSYWAARKWATRGREVEQTLGPSLLIWVSSHGPWLGLFKRN